MRPFKNILKYVLFISIILLLYPSKVYSVYFDGINSDKCLLKNEFDPQAALFAAYISADVYDESMIKLFLELRGFKDIQFVEDKSTDMQAIIAYKEIDNKKVILISFRGSQELQDWLTDATVSNSNFLDTKAKVHFGFYTLFNSFFLQQENIYINKIPLSDIISKHQNYRFVITGHSLGGAVATLYGAYLYENNVNDFIVFTFGAPGVGDEEFAKKYFEKFTLYRVTNRLDPVPYSTFLPKFYHIGEHIVFDKEGNNITQNYIAPQLSELVFSEHSIVSYIEHLKVAYFTELFKDKIASCNSLNVRYDGLFYCDEDNDVFYPKILEVYNKTGASSIINALFNNKSKELDEKLKLGSSERIDYEKKALESLILIDSTGFFKDDELLDILFGESYPNISKIDDIKQAQEATKILMNTFKMIVLLNVLKETDDLSENDIKYIIKEFNVNYGYKLYNLTITHLSKPTEFSKKIGKSIKSIISDIIIKFGEKFPKIKNITQKTKSITEVTINSLKEFSKNNLISKKYQSITAAFSNYIDKYKDEIKPFKSIKYFTSSTINVLGILASPIIEYAAYQKNNIKRKKVFLNILKPYISQKNYEYIYNKLDALEQDSIEAIYKAYYLSLDNIASINGIKNMFDIATAASDFAKVLKAIYSKMPNWISKLGKLSDIAVFKAGGVFFNQYDLMKNEKGYKDLIGASAISSSLSRYFLKSENKENKIMADLLMINSQKLFNASRYWTGSYNDIEKLSGKVVAFVDVGAAMLSEGVFGVLDNKFVSTYILTQQIDTINNTAGEDAFNETNKIYSSFYAEMMNFRKELITGKSSLPQENDIENAPILYSDSLSSDLYHIGDEYYSQFIISSDNAVEVRYYLENTKSRIWDITYNQDTAPDYDWVEYNLFYEYDNESKRWSFNLNQTATGKYRKTHHPFKNDNGYLFLVTTLNSTDKDTKSIHIREYKTNTDYVFDLSDALTKNIVPEKSSLQEVREAIYYDGGYSTQFNIAVQNKDILAYRFNFLEAKPTDGKWMIIKRNPTFTYTVFYGLNSDDFNKIEIPYIATFYDDLLNEFQFSRNVIAIKTDNIWALNQFTLERLLDYALENYTNSDAIKNILKDIEGDTLTVFTNINKLSLNQDSDNDGWTDIYEILVGTDPHKADTDGDEIKDSEDPNPLKNTSGIKREELVLNLKDVHPLANPKLYNSKIVYITNKQADSPYDDLYIVIGDKEIKIDSIYEKYANSDLTKNFKLDAIGNVALVSYRKRGDSFNIAVVDLKNLKILKVLDENEISYEIFKSLLYNDYIYSSAIDTLFVYDGLEKAFIGYKLTDFFNTPTLDKLDSISYQNSLTQTKLQTSPLSFRAYQDKLFVIVGDYEGYKFKIYDLKNLTLIKSLDIPQELGIEAKYNTISIYPASSNKAYFIFNGVLYEYEDSITKLANIDGKIANVENGIITIYQDNKALYFDTATKKLTAIKKISFTSVDSESLKIETIEADSGAILALSNAGVAYSDSIGISDNPEDISNSTQETQNSTDNSCNGLSEISYKCGPHIVGEIDIYDAKGISITKEYIYIVDGRKGLKIYNKNLQLLGELKIKGIARRIVVRNNYAYIAAHWGGVIVVDVTNPYQPAEVSSLDTYDAFDIALRGDYLYVADSFEGIKVIDIKNPYNPKIIESITTDDYVVSLDIEKNLLFAATGREGLSIFNLNNSVQLIGTLKTDGIALDVKSVGNYVYLACKKDGVAFIDISNPKKPVLLSKIKTNYALNLSIQDNLLFVADGSYGMKIYNIEDNMKPRLISLIKTGNAQFVSVENKCAYVVNDKDNIKIINFSKSKQPALVTDISLPVLAMDVKVYKDVLYIAGYKEYIQNNQNVWNGFWGIDISKVKQPKIISSLHLDFSDFDSVYGIDGYDSYLYTVDGDQQIRVISIKKPEEPQIVKSIYDERFDNFKDIIIHKGEAYLIGTQGLAILDLQNQNIISRLEIRYCNRIKVWNNYAFIATDFDGIKIIDISDPYNPEIIYSIDSFNFVKSISISNNFLYAINNNGVFVIDIHNLKNPSVVASLKMDNASDVEILDHYLLVADGKSGLKIVDISSPTKLYLVAQVDTDNAYKISLSHSYPNYVFLSDKEGGVKIIDWKKAIECYKATHKNNIQQNSLSNNSPEIFDYSKVINTNINKQISLTFKAYDKDGDTLTWTINNETFTGNEVAYEFTPTKPGVYEISAKVSDGKTSDEVTTTIVVYPDSQHQVTSNFFKDMESYKTSWSEAYDSVYDLLNRGIIKGELGSDGVYYYPQREASKLEFAKVFVKSVCSEFDGSSDFVNECLSSLGYSGIVQKPLNIDDINDDVKNYAIVTYNLGVFGDVATTPYVNFGDKISRIEVARFLVKTLNLRYISDIDENLKPFEDISDLSLDDQILTQLTNYYGYLKGDGDKFYPHKALTRVQLAIVANRILSSPKIDTDQDSININISTAYPEISVDNGVVKIDNNIIAYFTPKDAEVTTYLDAQNMDVLSNITKVSALDIVVSKDGLKSAKTLTLYANFLDSDNDGVVDIYDAAPTNPNIYSGDDNGNGIDDIDEIIYASYSDSTNYNNLYISKGWSLKAIPVNKEINVDTFDNVEILWKWDNQAKKWLAWSPKPNIMKILKKYEELGVIGLFNKIKPGEGFWIYSNVTDIKNFDGDSYGLEQLNLHRGLNLVGVGKDITVDDLRDRNIRYIWLYDSGKWRVWGENLSKDVYSKYKKVENIRSTDGFWVFVE